MHEPVLSYWLQLAHLSSLKHSGGNSDVDGAFKKDLNNAFHILVNIHFLHVTHSVYILL